MSTRTHDNEALTGLTNAEVAEIRKTMKIAEPRPFSLATVATRFITSPTQVLSMFFVLYLLITTDFFSAIVLLLSSTLPFLLVAFHVRAVQVDSRLMQRTPNQLSMVKRDGRWEKKLYSDLVPGDLLRVSRGNSILSDVLVVQGNVEVDTSVYNGVSTSSRCSEGVMIRNGSLITEGSCLGKVVVCDAPSAIELGNTKLNSSSSSHFVGNFLLWMIGVSVALSFLVSGFLMGYHQCSFRVVIIVCFNFIFIGIPFNIEAALVTFFSRCSSMLMKRQNICIQRLRALEAIGSADVICVDKTGTLTGEMKISFEHYIFQNHYNLHSLLELAALSIQWRQSPSGSREYAILRSVNLNYCDAYQQLNYAPRSATTLYSIAELRSSDGGQFKVAQGEGAAVRDILNCDANKRNEVNSVLNKLESQHRNYVLVANHLSDRVGWQPVGVIVFEDSAAPGCDDMVSDLWDKLSIQMKLVSGDAAERCENLANDVGIPTDALVRGTELPSALDPDSNYTLGAMHADTVLPCSVFAELGKQQKAVVLEVLRQCDEKCIYLGNGFNDIPAFQNSDVSIAVANAAPALRAVGDVVLIHENLHPHLMKLISLARAYLPLARNLVSFRIISSLYVILFSFAVLLLAPILSTSSITEVFKLEWLTAANALLVCTASCTTIALSADEIPNSGELWTEADPPPPDDDDLYLVSGAVDVNLQARNYSSSSHRSKAFRWNFNLLIMLTLPLTSFYTIGSLYFYFYLAPLLIKYLDIPSHASTAVVFGGVFLQVCWNYTFLFFVCRSKEPFFKQQLPSLSSLMVLYCSQVPPFILATFVTCSDLANFGQVFKVGYLLLFVFLFNTVYFLIAECFKFATLALFKNFSVCLQPHRRVDPRKRKCVDWLWGITNIFEDKL